MGLYAYDLRIILTVIVMEALNSLIREADWHLALTPYLYLVKLLLTVHLCMLTIWCCWLPRTQTICNA